MEASRISTGIRNLDRLLNYLRPGENVLWQHSADAPIGPVVRSFLRNSADGQRPLIFLDFGAPSDLLQSGGIPEDRLTLVRWDPSAEHPREDEDNPFERTVSISHVEDPRALVANLRQIEPAHLRNASVVVDSVTNLADIWGTEKALECIKRISAWLQGFGAVTCWLKTTGSLPGETVPKIEAKMHVVLALSGDRGHCSVSLRKAEGRASSRTGIPHRLEIEDDHIEFSPERREELEMSILNDVSEAIGQALELENVFEQTMEVLASELEMERGTLVLLDRISDNLRIAAAHGLAMEEKERGTYNIGEGVTGRVVQTGQAVAIHDVSREPDFLNRTGARRQDVQSGKLSFVCVPLRVDGEVEGAISIDRHNVDDETLRKDRRLLQIIASLVGQAIKINRMAMMQQEELREENLRLRKDLHSRYKFGNIVAASSAMQDVVATAGTVAKSDATVLVRGETGTGKELVASVLHYNSDRADGPFIKVNCGALSENLLESELFGHVRGAFTGAVDDRKGRFELADGGTIFLDEVGSISERLQVKLLRVLQEKQFERVGGTETIDADTRVVAATNVNMEKKIEEGEFREDLYYRLNVIPIFIPPLRERREDIPFLVDHFLEKYNDRYDKDVSKMSGEIMDIFLEYPWPGNVRELENCIERAVVLSQTGSITMNLLPINIRSLKQQTKDDIACGDPQKAVPRLVETLRKSGPRTNLHERIISRVEKALLQQVLEDNDYTQTRAAEELGLSRNTVRRKMKELGIETE